MVANINSATVAQGKMSHVKEMWLKFVEHRNKITPDVQRLLLTPLCGDLNEIVLISVHPSLASLEETWENERQDAEGQAIREQSRPFELSRTRRMYRVAERS